MSLGKRLGMGVILDGHIEVLRGKGRPFAKVGDKVFVRKGPAAVPLGPVGSDFTVTPDQANRLLRELGGWWVQYTDGFRWGAESSSWYAVLCRGHVSLANIVSGNTRSKLRRGLKHCRVVKVNPGEIAEKGYETYCAALQGYKGWNGAVPSPKEFERSVNSDAPFPDVRHQWAVYHRDDMIAFAQNLVYWPIEVDYTLIKLHPAFLKLYPAYALIYTMNQYYLEDQGFEYVSDGFRSVLHQTGVQQFLIDKFGFERAYTGLHMHYRFPLGAAVQLLRPARALVRKMSPSVGALLELDRLRVRGCGMDGLDEAGRISGPQQ